MVAWGTLCVLATVQTVIALKLLSSDAAPKSAAVASPVPVISVPKTVPSVVPEVGQIALPPVASAPPLPGSLVAVPTAPVSSGPPPIGSFTRPGVVSQAPAAPATPAQLPPVSPVTAAPAPAVMPPPVVPKATPGMPKAPPAAVTSARPAAPTAVPMAATPAPAPATPMAATPAPVPATPMAATPAPAPTAAGVPPGFPATVPPIKSLSGQDPAALAAAKPSNKPDPNAGLLRDVNFVISSAKEIRGMSDMQGALELLRRADEVNPDHPAIIAEMAQTYEQMGITAKATDAWRRIQLLGATKAGSFFELASRRLGSGSAAVAAPPGSASGAPESEKFLRLGACQVARDFSVSSGERYVLRVPIVRAGNRPINSQEMNLEVFFFDRVNNEKVAQTIAPEPVEAWQSAPVDWQGTGEEVLDVVYHLPALSAAEIQQHGRRTYYGYMLRLYYNNKLQDVASEPRDLLEYGSTPGAAPGGANPLLPLMGK